MWSSFTENDRPRKSCLEKVQNEKKGLSKCGHLGIFSGETKCWSQQVAWRGCKEPRERDDPDLYQTHIVTTKAEESWESWGYSVNLCWVEKVKRKCLRGEKKAEMPERTTKIQIKPCFCRILSEEETSCDLVPMKIFINENMVPKTHKTERKDCQMWTSRAIFSWNISSVTTSGVKRRQGDPRTNWHGFVMSANSQYKD